MAGPDERPRARRRASRAALVVALAAFALFRPGPAADARAAAPVTPLLSSGLQVDLVSGFLGEINLLRRTLGLPALSVSSQLSSVATQWSQRMASEDRLYHNPGLGDLVSGWSMIGENVGVGYDVLGLMQAFIGSPSHYANLVNPRWTHVGVGVASGPNGTIYTTHDFMEAESAPPPAADPEPTPDPEPAPDPTPNPRRTPPRAPAPEAPTTTISSPSEPVAPVVPVPHPTEQRAAAILTPLRALEAGPP